MDKNYQSTVQGKNEVMISYVLRNLCEKENLQATEYANSKMNLSF